MPKSRNRRKKKKSPISTKAPPKRPAPCRHDSMDITAGINTAMQYYQAGQLRKAERICREIISVDPSHPDAMHMLGLIAHRADHNEGAAVWLEKAVAKNPENSAYRNNLGNVYVALNRLEDAETCFEKAIQIGPDVAEAHINLGNALKYQGKATEAEQQYRRALAINPDAVSAYYNLAQVKRFEKRDTSVSALESIKERTPLTDSQWTEYHFALGKIHADIGEYDAAFRNYQTGNAYRKKLTGNRFSLDSFKNQIALYQRAFHAGFFKHYKKMGHRTQVPIFIVGMPRSGTSLVEQILSSHPGVFGAGELPLINQIVQAFFTQHNGAPFDRILASLDENRVTAMARHYMDKIEPVPVGTVRVTDKLPGNFLNLWLIAVLFPNAKIIHCRRNPMDTCLSCYFTHFKQPLPYKNDLYTLGRYYRQYEQLMAHWQAVLPVPVFEIQYESLVENQEVLSRKMVAFCELDWDKKCLSFHQNHRPVTTASGMQVRRKIYTTSVGRWRPYERFLAPLIRGLADQKT